MTDDPETHQRFLALSAEAKQISELPDIGQPEVERLAAIVDEMNAILDDLPEERLRRFRQRLHQGRGRAIDIPPPIPPEMRPATEWVERPYRRRNGDHIHWAYKP